MIETLRAMQAKRAEGDRGFTLIELLVVVVIIGILVAIAIPVYLNYRQGAADKSAQSDVRGAVNAVELYYTTNANTYPTSSVSQTASFNLGGATGPRVSVSSGVTVSYFRIDATSYRVCGRSAGGSESYLYESATGGSVRSAAVGLPLDDCN